MHCIIHGIIVWQKTLPSKLKTPRFTPTIPMNLSLSYSSTYPDTISFKSRSRLLAGMSGKYVDQSRWDASRDMGSSPVPHDLS
jgi:hypothetical protein